jgi:two-component system, cell cycle response regulator
MAVLDQGVAEWQGDPATGEPTVPVQHPAGNTDLDETSLVELHQSIASLLASRGEWRQAYEHLRHALDLATADRTPQVPERIRQEVARLRREHAEAREQSLRDSLTASYNRRYLDQRLVDAGHPRGPLGLALVDLDLFKQVNDTYGHLVGDRVLQQVVELLQDGLPDGAFCARYGGEEFVLVLPDLSAAAACAVAEAARTRVERYAWTSIVRGLAVTVSIGVSHESGESDHTTPEQQLRLADGLLYTAKQSGRNTVAYRVEGQVRLSGTAQRRRSRG